MDDAGWDSHEVKIVVNEKMPGDFLTDVSDVPMAFSAFFN